MARLPDPGIGHTGETGQKDRPDRADPLRILVYCPVFHPSVGGLEISTQLLCEEIAGRGHELKLVSTTPSTSPETFPFEVIRSPSPRRLLGLVSWSEVLFYRNVSLRGMWPMLLIRRPWVVSHHGWYRLPDGRLGLRNRLKHFVVRFANGSISISPAVAAHLETSSVVILNPYRDDVFHALPAIERHGDLVFVGRLVSDKGADLLLEALALLARRGLRPGLTVVGDGPERSALETQARKLGIGGQVVFVGMKTGAEVARLLHEHQILVVPSRYEEPFGNVALEGIACGCVVVGSRGGGLRDAIGSCGLTFPNQDMPALAAALEEVLVSEARRFDLRRHAARHLANHTRAAVASRYLEILERAARPRHTASESVDPGNRSESTRTGE